MTYHNDCKTLYEASDCSEDGVVVVEVEHEDGLMVVEDVIDWTENGTNLIVEFSSEDDAHYQSGEVVEVHDQAELNSKYILQTVDGDLWRCGDTTQWPEIRESALNEKIELKREDNSRSIMLSPGDAILYQDTFPMVEIIVEVAPQIIYYQIEIVDDGFGIEHRAMNSSHGSYSRGAREPLTDFMLSHYQAYDEDKEAYSRISNSLIYDHHYHVVHDRFNIRTQPMDNLELANDPAM